MAAAQPPRTRRARPTFRCLSDLGLSIPAAAIRLDDVDHPVLRKAAELAPAHPENQIRIQAIGDTMVYRFTHGRNRVLTWLEHDTNIVWVCGADLRREDDGYDAFLALHDRGELLPGEADTRRLEDEAILELGHTIRDGASAWVEDARQHPGTERRFILPGGATVRLFFAPGEGTSGLWAAIPTLLANELGLPGKVRGLAVAAITETLGGTDIEFEQRHDWPTGRSLQNFEVAFFWVT